MPETQLSFGVRNDKDIGPVLDTSLDLATLESHLCGAVTPWAGRVRSADWLGGTVVDITNPNTNFLKA
jgi:hypothetical protein